MIVEMSSCTSVYHICVLRTLLILIVFLQVNAKAGGKAAIHCACAQGNLDVLKCLLEFSPNLEIEVCT